MYLSISRVLTRDRRDPLGSSSPARSLAKAEARAATTRAGIVTKDSRIRRAHGSASADRTRGRAGYQFDRSCVCRAGCPTNNDSGGVWTGAPPFASAILSRGASRDAPDVPRARSPERARGSAVAGARPRKRASAASAWSSAPIGVPISCLRFVRTCGAFSRARRRDHPGSSGVWSAVRSGRAWFFADARCSRVSSRPC